MNTHRYRLFLPLALLLAVPTLARAQTAVTPPSGDITVRHAGEHEFTLGGSGASNKDFNQSFGGVNFSIGQYLTDTQELTLRQTVNYTNPQHGGQSWNGATRVAFDQHFASHGVVLPFVGASLGGVYGDAVRDTWAAGLELGGKFYVQQRTFVYAIIGYDWFFRHARNIDDRFKDGQFNWGVGIGFNF